MPQFESAPVSFDVIPPAAVAFPMAPLPAGVPARRAVPASADPDVTSAVIAVIAGHPDVSRPRRDADDFGPDRRRPCPYINAPVGRTARGGQHRGCENSCCGNTLHTPSHAVSP